MLSSHGATLYGSWTLCGSGRHVLLLFERSLRLVWSVACSIIVPMPVLLLLVELVLICHLLIAPGSNVHSLDVTDVSLLPLLMLFLSRFTVFSYAVSTQHSPCA